MVGALVAVFGLIVAMWAMTAFLHRDVQNPARTIDYAPALRAARAQSPFPVLAPTPVPAGLRATSVEWDGVGRLRAWRLGFVSGDGSFIGLYEGNGPADAFIESSTPAHTPGSPVTIAGRQWLTLTDAGRGETALVHTAQGVTTVVTGTAGEPALESFARALR